MQLAFHSFPVAVIVINYCAFCQVCLVVYFYFTLFFSFIYILFWFAFRIMPTIFPLNVYFSLI